VYRYCYLTETSGVKEIDVKDVLTRYQEVPRDIKDSTAQTESVTDGNNDVTLKKGVDNTHQLE
jgi:hypothetical protein